MDLEEIRKRFRAIDREDYPDLGGMSLEEIYCGKMGPGGLFLASQMVGRLDLPPKPSILDLGCGRGATSRFLSKIFGATVSAVDLWIAVEDRISFPGVTHFCADIRQETHFSSEMFEAIFCMDAFHYFGASQGVLERLSALLRPGGGLVVGNPCFDRELESEVPSVYQAFWDDEFSKYHSPGWWGRLLEDSTLFTDIFAGEAPDGQLFWEDEILYDLDRENLRAGRISCDAAEVVFGRDNPTYPYLTHMILSCRKPA